MSDAVTGGCLCGAVTFEADLPSRFCAHCHCDNCRRAHGAAFVTWVGFPGVQFRFTKGEANLTRSKTATDATRSFCTTCGTTFGATTGTPYKRLQHFIRAFDRVAALSVEGMNKSATARIERLSWNTVARWLERAAATARRSNRGNMRGLVIRELQLDELSTRGAASCAGLEGAEG